jgi:dTDP-4-amino-4,6-dideoxygalactose transaminase
MDPAKLNDFLDKKCTCGPDGTLVSNRTGKRIAAVIPVHLYGQMADMDAIVALAEHYNLVVIEDACQAHGAEYFSRKLNRWCKAGSIGRAAAFSFYPGKNLGACGEGGAVVTNDDAVASKVRMVRDHGQEEKYYHLVEGYNGRLDAIQAGMLSVKLAHLEQWNRKRQEAAGRYGVLLRSVTDAITLPQEPTWSKAVYHLYVIRTQQRDQLRAHLSEAGIGTGVHYPIPLHLQKAYGRLGYKPGDFPVAEACAAEILSLPMYPQIEEEQLERVARSVTAFSRQALTRPIAA